MIHLTAAELQEKLKNIYRYAKEYNKLVRCKDGNLVEIDEILAIFGFCEIYERGVGLVIKEIKGN